MGRPALSWPPWRRQSSRPGSWASWTAASCDRNREALYCRTHGAALPDHLRAAAERLGPQATILGDSRRTFHGVRYRPESGGGHLDGAPCLGLPPRRPASVPRPSQRPPPLVPRFVLQLFTPRFWTVSLEQMSGAGNHFQPALATDFEPGRLIEEQDLRIVIADNQQCGKGDLVQYVARKVGSSAATSMAPTSQCAAAAPVLAPKKPSGRPSLTGLPQVLGSGGDRYWWVWIVVWPELLSETGAESTIREHHYTRRNGPQSGTLVSQVLRTDPPGRRPAEHDCAFHCRILDPSVGGIPLRMAG
jgi:hypothetical protein